MSPRNDKPISRPGLLAAGSPAGDPGCFPDAMIEMCKVVKTFHNAAGEFVVLKGIDAAFREYEFVSVVGRSGSGKSTLLNMMTGIDHPTSGTVRVGGTYLHSMNEGQMSVWRGKQMGIVFQFFQLLPMLTLLENVMLPMDFCDMYAASERETKALDLLRMVGLEGLEHKYPAAVAGGQQQSAAVARALANDPPILVADEPTGNLDSRTAERVLEIFEEQVVLGKTVIMVTHDSGLAQRAHRVMVISDGELVNEAISIAFPDLSHAALLQLSHAAHPVRFAEGETICHSEDGPDLFIVTSGQVDVIAGAMLGTQVVADRLEVGEIFSCPAVRSAAKGLAGLRAAATVEALAFDSLPDLPEIRQAVEQGVRECGERINRSGRQRGERGLLV
jgi:putative ABC transport system ATP-binding protein